MSLYLFQSFTLSVDKWAVATKCQVGWALYKDAAGVMAGSAAGALRAVV